jgi:hypothetical protein
MPSGGMTVFDGILLENIAPWGCRRQAMLTLVYALRIQRGPPRDARSLNSSSRQRFYDDCWSAGLAWPLSACRPRSSVRRAANFSGSFFEIAVLYKP